MKTSDIVLDGGSRKSFTAETCELGDKALLFYEGEKMTTCFTANDVLKVEEVDSEAFVPFDDHEFSCCW